MQLAASKSANQVIVELMLFIPVFRKHLPAIRNYLRCDKLVPNHRMEGYLMPEKQLEHLAPNLRRIVFRMKA